jgi:hypothetical protein
MHLVKCEKIPHFGKVGNKQTRENAFASDDAYAKLDYLNFGTVGKIRVSLDYW